MKLSENRVSRPDLESLSNEELKKLEQKFQRLHKRSQETDARIGEAES